MKIPKNQKLQRLLKVFTPDNTLPDFSAFDVQINQLKSNLKDKITVKTLEQVNSELEKFKKRINLQPLFDALAEIETTFKEDTQSLYDELSAKTIELQNADEKRANSIKTEITDLNLQISILETSFKTDLAKIKIPDITDLEDRVNELTTDLTLLTGTLEADEQQEIKDWTDAIEKVRKELLNRINNIGGGNMNRNISVGGNSSMLSRYTDINLKAGSNVTLTYSNNNTTKYLDLTIAATGGAGTSRSISTVTVSSIIVATASTDIVVLANAGIQLTLPTAVSNTNLYTIKNIGTSSVLINTTGAETIDTALTLIMPVQFTSVDLISDSVNWNIT